LLQNPYGAVKLSCPMCVVLVWYYTYGGLVELIDNQLSIIYRLLIDILVVIEASHLLINLIDWLIEGTRVPGTLIDSRNR